MRKTVDVDTNKVIQVKYIGSENWGNMKEKIENGPKKVRTFMVYLNVESDMDTIMDYIIDPVAGSPSRNKTVNGNVCMHVDDLIFTGTGDFLSSFAESLKKSFQIGSLDENDLWAVLAHFGESQLPQLARSKEGRRRGRVLGFARRSTARSQVRNAQTQSQVIHFIEATFNDFHGLGR